MTAEPQADTNRQQPHYPAPPMQSPYGVPGAPAGYAPNGLPAQAPGVGPVVGFTALFGVFGAISASRRASRARALGLPGGKYWIAFAATLAVAWGLFGILVAVAAAGSTTITSSSLEQSIVKDGDFKGAGGVTAKATSATCAAQTVDAKGVGTYRCMVDFSANDRMSYLVTVDSDGKWVTNSGD